jgi:PadR family transcriptional regulator AphA
MARASDDRLLLGEWACLGVLYHGPTHGFAIAARLKPNTDIGRVWSLSRPLTYRAIDQLTARELIRPIGEEPGIAGGPRTILAATRRGRSQFRAWVTTPVAHMRDLRSELLLKLVLAELCDIDVRPMLEAQLVQCQALADALTITNQDAERVDVVDLWRSEASQTAIRFLHGLLE